MRRFWKGSAAKVAACSLLVVCMAVFFASAGFAQQEMKLNRLDMVAQSGYVTSGDNAVDLAGVVYHGFINLHKTDWATWEIPVGCTALSAFVGTHDGDNDAGIRVVRFLVDGNVVQTVSLGTGQKAIEVIIPFNGGSSLKITNSGGTTVLAEPKLISTPIDALPADDAVQYNTDNAQVADFSKSELEEILSPIALYPDPLLAQIFPAATYPDQLADAAQVTNYRVNEGVIDAQNWDVSVKSIAHYPSILRMMVEKADWTTSVGQAYAGQPDAVMNCIQDLRAKAKKYGNLRTNQYQRVYVEEDAIRIVPVQTSYIYVPCYNPSVVYVESYRSDVVIFTAGLIIGAWLNNDVDWHHHYVYYHGWRGHGWYDHCRPYGRTSRIYMNSRWHAHDRVWFDHGVRNRDVGDFRRMVREAPHGRYAVGGKIQRPGPAPEFRRGFDRHVQQSNHGVPDRGGRKNGVISRPTQFPNPGPGAGRNPGQNTRAVNGRTPGVINRAWPFGTRGNTQVGRTQSGGRNDSTNHNGATDTQMNPPNRPQTGGRDSSGGVTPQPVIGMQPAHGGRAYTPIERPSATFGKGSFGRSNRDANTGSVERSNSNSNNRPSERPMGESRGSSFGRANTSSNPSSTSVERSIGRSNSNSSRIERSSSDRSGSKGSSERSKGHEKSDGGDKNKDGKKR